MAYRLSSLERLEVDGVPLATTAWYTLNVAAVWPQASLRGSDVLIPGATGVRSYRRRKTVTKGTLSIVVLGIQDPEGVAFSNVRVGIEENWAALKAALDPIDSDPGTRTAVLYMPSGSTLTGPIKTESLSAVGFTPSGLAVSWDFSLPLGELT